MLFHKKLSFDGLDEIKRDYLMMFKRGDIDNPHFQISLDTLYEKYPTFINSVKSQGLELREVFCMTFPASTQIPTHIDMSCAPKVFSLAFNLPITSDKGMFMSWVDHAEVKQLCLTYYDENNHCALYQGGKNHSVIERLEITEPFMARIDIPHNVMNTNYEDNLLLSFRFNPEPWHLWGKNEPAPPNITKLKLGDTLKINTDGDKTTPVFSVY